MNEAPSTRTFAALVLLYALLAPFFIANDSPAMSQRELLPTSVRPLHYDLTLAPDLEKFVFTGSETVRVNVTEETDRVVVHAKELEIQSAECSPEGGAPVKASDISFNKEDETAVFTFPSKIPVGPASLRIAFMGTLNDKMAGFYRSQYTTSSGETRHMAVTQFEATDARRAFPCWDEPALKATFQTTLIVPSDRLALSNTMPEEEKQTEDGRTQIRFAKTPIMSTYLLAFVVGEFDHVEDKTKEGVLVRVFTPKGQAEKGRFALEVGVKCLSFYTEYFNIPYPLEKLDMVAIADFAAGAMENWGLVTYRSVLVMYDEATTPAHIKQRIAYVVAHELAHQWFGNLVTMEWWMHLWLNEGFATYIGWKATDVIFPDWSIWEQFTVGDQLQGLRLDALRTSHPIEVEIAKASQVDEIFDHISYCKGASVIRMLVNYLGEEDFRAGMQSYLKRHQFANAATEHLWAALSESSGKPVKDVMDSWTKQTGHPVVKASAHSDTELSVSQERYLASGPDALTDEDKTVLWQVPLRLADGDATVLTSRSAVVPRPDIPKINRGQTSFFRVAYDAPLIKAIGESFAALAPVDRVGVNNDAFALASAGYTSVTSALELLSHLRADDEYTVLSDAFGSIAEVLSVWYDADEAMLGHIRQFAIGIVQPVVERVGWEPRDGESHLIKMLRTEALSFAGKLGVPEVVAEARRRFANILSGNTSETPADLRSAVYATVVRHGGVQEVDQIIELFRKSNSSDQRVVMLTSSGASADPAAVEKALQWSLTDDVRSQDLFYVLGSASANGRGRESAWQFLQKNWNVLFERYGGGAFLLARVATISCETFASNERADEIEAFFATKSVPGIERPVSQAVEKVRARAAWRARDTDQLRAWLAQRFQS